MKSYRIAVIAGDGIGKEVIPAAINVLNLAAGAYAAIAYSGEQRASGVFSLVFSIIVLWLLYGTEKDRDFFAA